MTKFDIYKAAIEKVIGFMKERFMEVLLRGEGDALSDERGALTAVMEGALHFYLEQKAPFNLELAKQLLTELKTKALPTAEDFHAIGCAIVGPND